MKGSWTGTATPRKTITVNTWRPEGARTVPGRKTRMREGGAEGHDRQDMHLHQ